MKDSISRAIVDTILKVERMRIKVVHYTVPRVLKYVLSFSGLCHTMDA
jgi:hypothetical protein